MSAPLRLGVIGCGTIAQAHAVAIRFNAEDGLVRCVAAADPDPAGVDRFVAIAGDVEHRGPNGYDVIDNPDVDAVVLITPTRFHREFVLATCAAGKPLFTEKPLAPTFDVVRELRDAVRDAGIAAQVGFQSRFHPIVRYVRDLVQSGELGAPMAYTLRDDQYWPTGDVVPGHSNWRSDVDEAGGGALLEHSIHSCDVLGWLFGPAARVYATKRNVFGYSVEDVAALTIEHGNGVVGNLVTVFNGVVGREERRLEVFFERGSVELTTDFIVGAPEDSLLVQRPDTPAERFDVDRLRRDTFARDGCDPAREVFVYQYFAHRAFACSLRDGNVPSPGLADAYQAHAIVEAGYRSAATRLPVELSSFA
ncbi:MAG TPA: Gfo/Idh/MocA family oxidoreductase [Acidimicrobiia bacterium]